MTDEVSRLIDVSHGTCHAIVHDDFKCPHLWDLEAGYSTPTISKLICFGTGMFDQEWYHCASTASLLSRFSPC